MYIKSGIPNQGLLNQVPTLTQLLGCLGDRDMQGCRRRQKHSASRLAAERLWTCPSIRTPAFLQIRVLQNCSKECVTTKVARRGKLSRLWASRTAACNVACISLNWSVSEGFDSTTVLLGVGSSSDAPSLVGLPHEGYAVILQAQRCSKQFPLIGCTDNNQEPPRRDQDIIAPEVHGLAAASGSHMIAASLSWLHEGLLP